MSAQNRFCQVFTITPDYDGFDALLLLIQDAFATMDGVIDPPSSAGLLNAAILRGKAGTETAYGVLSDGQLAGCVFLADKGDHLYLGKLAVAAPFRGLGVARRLVEQAEKLGRERGMSHIDLQVRIELTDNQKLFKKLGFEVVGETMHPGFTRVTSLTMRKALL
ncbi:GNAT family N-acetyltransferase [Pseudochrobactrum sp. B5]|uniref:GNAT family N-acetyltransferase n=1 Tax=Pseudochrobactrum sp. B5 TaxID=1289478 RepID=UPI0009522FE7|nr:GNAT family N-acetyltransferase [Pseudochrobactrum sp. B5]